MLLCVAVLGAGADTATTLTVSQAQRESYLAPADTAPLELYHIGGYDDANRPIELGTECAAKSFNEKLLFNGPLQWCYLQQGCDREAWSKPESPTLPEIFGPLRDSPVTSSNVFAGVCRSAGFDACGYRVECPAPSCKGLEPAECKCWNWCLAQSRNHGLQYLHDLLKATRADAVVHEGPAANLSDVTEAAKGKLQTNLKAAEALDEEQRQTNERYTQADALRVDELVRELKERLRLNGEASVAGLATNYPKYKRQFEDALAEMRRELQSLHDTAQAGMNAHYGEQRHLIKHSFDALARELARTQRTRLVDMYSQSSTLVRDTAHCLEPAARSFAVPDDVQAADAGTC